MKILNLPGINPITEQWMKNLSNILDLGQTTAKVQKYQCWNIPGSGFDLEVEIGKAEKEHADVIIAKSIGTVLALNGYQRGLFTARRYIFIGTPIRGLKDREKNILRVLVTGAIPVLFIQQSDDRAGNIHELRKLVVATASVTVMEIPGDDHMYSDIHQLKSIIEKWYEDSGR